MGRGLAYSIISAVCLGTLAIWAKLGLGLGMAPTEIVQYRFTFGAVLLFAWLGITRPELLRIRPRALLKAAVLGGCVYPVQSYCFVKSLQYIPAATTSLLYYLYPLGTTLLAMAFLGLRPGRIVLWALGLVALGCALVFHNALARDLDPRGIFFALACMTSFSVYLTLIQVFTRRDEARRISVWVIACMAVVFSLVSPPTKILAQPLEGWLVAAGLGLIPTALAVSLIYRAVEAVGSAYVAIFSTVEPVTTVLLAWLALGERIDATQVAGMGCIIAGVALPNWRLVRRRESVEDPGG